VLRILRRVWLPLLIAVVATVGGFAVARVRDMFGHETFGYVAEGNRQETKPFNPKRLTYEVYGTSGTVADLNYYDENAQPTQINGVRLPWSFTIVTTLTSLSGNIVAQGDGSQIGCRIIVNGEVRSERVSNEHDAYTYCIAKSA
jgi:Mycobacterium membrane protein